jgi:predicted N-acetyltransferase YhbS
VSLELARAHAPAGLSGLQGWERLSDFVPGRLEDDRADAHWTAHDGGRVLAHCSLWWREAPQLPGERVAAIGHYAAADAASGGLVLARALEELRGRGRTLAVGPLDGTTWRRYRFVTWRGTEPPFFLEPDNPDEWPGHFADAGFAPIAGYSSASGPLGAEADPRLAGLGRAVAARGVLLRTLDLARFEEEMRRIHAVAAASFSGNFLAGPLPLADFLALYGRIRPHVDPRLVLLAEREGELVGFMFALPDALQARGGERPTRVLIKTVAVLPSWRGGRIGSWLVMRAREEARRLGYRDAVHALMHDASSSVRFGVRITKTMRRYTLYGTRLVTP